MIESAPALSQFLVLVLTLGTVCVPLMGMARLMEAGRVHEAKRARVRAEEEARRCQAEMRLAAEKRAIAEKFAKAGLGHAGDEAERGA